MNERSPYARPGGPDRTPQPVAAQARPPSELRLDLPVVLPQLVVVLARRPVVPDIEEEVFFTNGFYWCRHDGGWCRSRDAPRRLGYMEPHRVPPGLDPDASRQVPALARRPRPGTLRPRPHPLARRRPATRPPPRATTTMGPRRTATRPQAQGAATGSTGSRQACPPPSAATGPLPDPRRPFAYATRVARAARACPGNVPGDLFVDDACIACDTCRRLAPAVFGGGEDDHAFVGAAARGAGRSGGARSSRWSPARSRRSARARRTGVTEAAAALPDPFAPGVLRCGYAAESSFGAASLARAPAGRERARRLSPLRAAARAPGSARSAASASCSSPTATTWPTTRAGARRSAASGSCTRAT